MSVIGNFLISALTYIVAISLLVAVHEYGHFWVARRLGIKVLRYSIGFGRVVWSRYGKDGVEYAISAVPLGGYVRMLDERDGSATDEDRHLAFNRAPVWKRIAVLFAGPGFNFIFALVAYWVLFMTGVPGLTPVVGEVKPDSLAASAGLRPDDTIRSVGDREVNTREAAMMAILAEVLDDGVVELGLTGTDGSQRIASIDASGRSRELTEPNALFDGLGFDFWAPQASTELGFVQEGDPAALAELRVGDRIVSFDGRLVSDGMELTRMIRDRAGQRVAIEIERDGQRFDKDIVVGSMNDAGKLVGKIGVRFTATWPAEMQVLQREGPIAAVSSAASETWDKTKFTVEVIWHLVTGKVSLKSISGPIGIATVAGTAVKYGFFAFVSLLALISISVGVLNLLPVPILDGGQIVYQLAELLKGAPVSERAQIVGQQVGMVLLAMLMLLAVFNDLAPHFG
jgi:regulator of sigma E protease